MILEDEEGRIMRMKLEEERSQARRNANQEQCNQPCFL